MNYMLPSGVSWLLKGSHCSSKSSFVPFYGLHSFEEDPFLLMFYFIPNSPCLLLRSLMCSFLDFILSFQITSTKSWHVLRAYFRWDGFCMVLQILLCSLKEQKWLPQTWSENICSGVHTFLQHSQKATLMHLSPSRCMPSLKKRPGCNLSLIASFSRRSGEGITLFLSWWPCRAVLKRYWHICGHLTVIVVAVWRLGLRKRPHFNDVSVVSLTHF